MVTVVDVAIAEEDRGGVVPQHDLGLPGTDQTHQGRPHLSRVLDLTVGVTEAVVLGESQHAGRGPHLVGPSLGQTGRFRRGIVAALVAEGAHDQGYLTSSASPRGKSCAACDLGISRVGIHG